MLNQLQTVHKLIMWSPLSTDAKVLLTVRTCVAVICGKLFEKGSLMLEFISSVRVPVVVSCDGAEKAPFAAKPLVVGELNGSGHSKEPLHSGYFVPFRR